MQVVHDWFQGWVQLQVLGKRPVIGHDILPLGLRPQLQLHPTRVHLPITHQPHRMRRQQRRAQGCFYLLHDRVHRVACDVGDDLHPQVRMARPAHHNQARVQGMRALAARFDIVAQGKTHALQHRAVQVKAAVVEVEPDKTAAGAVIPHRAALAHQVRQKHHAFAACRNLHRALLQQRQAVLPRGLGLLFFGLAELLAKPADRGPGGDRTAEDVQVAVAVVDVGHAHQTVTCIHLLVQIAPAHAGADHRHMIAWLSDTRRQGRHGRVHAPSEDRRARLQAQACGPVCKQTTHHLAGIQQPLGHHRLRDTQRLQHLA